MVKRKQANPRVPVTIRLPATVVQKIDEELEQRPVPVSRNNWLLEAAIEKLRRKGAKGVRDGTE